MQDGWKTNKVVNIQYEHQVSCIFKMRTIPCVNSLIMLNASSKCHFPYLFLFSHFSHPNSCKYYFYFIHADPNPHHSSMLPCKPVDNSLNLKVTLKHYWWLVTNNGKIIQAFRQGATSRCTLDILALERESQLLPSFTRASFNFLD